MAFIHLNSVCTNVTLTLTLYSIDTHFDTSTRQLLKTSWEKKKLLVMSNFFFSHTVFYSIRKLYPHLSIFLTSYLYLLLNRKSPKLAYQVKDYFDQKRLNLYQHLLVTSIFPFPRMFSNVFFLWIVKNPGFFVRAMVTSN